MNNVFLKKKILLSYLTFKSILDSRHGLAHHKTWIIWNIGLHGILGILGMKKLNKKNDSYGQIVHLEFFFF